MLQKLHLLTDHYNNNLTEGVEKAAEAVFAGRGFKREHGDVETGFLAYPTKKYTSRVPELSQKEALQLVSGRLRLISVWSLL